MKRLAFCIGLGLLAAPFVGCDKGGDTKAIAPGEQGDKRGDIGQRDDGELRTNGSDEPAATVSSLADGMKYIPDGANLLIGIDAVKVVDSAVMQDNLHMLTRGDVGEMIAVAEACNVGMSTWKYAVVGGNTEADKEVVVVLSATDIGKKDTLDCIGKNVTETDPQDRFEVGEEDGRVVVSGGIDGMKMYAVSDDVVALVGADWLQTFKDLLDGQRKTALEGSLKDVLASVDQSKHIYFGMVATPPMQEGPAATLKHVTGTAYLSAGLAIVLSADFADVDRATEFAGVANTQFDQMKGMAGAVGIPYAVVDSVRIEAKGATVALSVSAAGNDLEHILEKINVTASGPGDTAAQD